MASSPFCVSRRSLFPSRPELQPGCVPLESLTSFVRLAYSPPDMLKPNREAATAVLPDLAPRTFDVGFVTLLALLGLLLLTTTGVG